MKTRLLLALVLLLAACDGDDSHSRAPGEPCMSEMFAAQDRADIAAARLEVEAECPCEDADSADDYEHCVRGAADDLADDGELRDECVDDVVAIESDSSCGRPGMSPCLTRSSSDLALRACAISTAQDCVDDGDLERHFCSAATHCLDAADSNGDGVIAPPDDLRCVTRTTIDIPSAAMPPHTPGSPGVVVTNAGLLTQFGGGDFDLNRARYTRFRAQRPGLAPDAVLILIPGFEGGAMNFKIFAENLIPRLAAAGAVVEVWAVDRRTNQLEDRAGLVLAEQLGDPLVALDWLFGEELGLPLSPALQELGHRAVFHDTQGDVPFIAEWSNLVFSHDIDAIVAAADTVVRDHNVFLGGHSAGTGFTARYAATDFNTSGEGASLPGYTKLRGLVLLEGGGGSSANADLSEDALDRIEAKFDGGLFGAVRDNAPRCVDGTTPCTIATEAADCAGQAPPVCTEPTTAYAVVPGILNPRILATPEPGVIQTRIDPGSQTLIQQDIGEPGNNVIAKVPDLASLAFLPPADGPGALGTFVDDDGVVAQIASFIATSAGSPGPVVDGLLTWNDISQPQPEEVLVDNGPPPTDLPGGIWGREKEVTDIVRFGEAFVAGETNFSDWYYPSAGQSITTSPGRCADDVCAVGDVGAPCEDDGDCARAVGLDSTALSVGRGRRDIENLTQAANIDIPVIAFGGTNGLLAVPGRMIPFAQSIGPCTAPSCDGTPRIVDATSPNPAFPTFGDAAGGFEVYLSEGFAHLDVVTAEDNDDNNVLAPLTAFLVRNIE